jgi:hypothetical protein
MIVVLQKNKWGKAGRKSSENLYPSKPRQAGNGRAFLVFGLPRRAIGEAIQSQTDISGQAPWENPTHALTDPAMSLSAFPASLNGLR